MIKQTIPNEKYILSNDILSNLDEFPSRSFSTASISCSNSKSTKKYFNIKKFVKIKHDNKEFLKYRGKTEQEKIEKMQFLSKMVRKYRRKISILKRGFKNNMEKIFIDTLQKKTSKNKRKKSSHLFSLSNLILTMKKLRESEEIEFVNDRFILVRLIDLIVEGKLKLDSIQFKIISTQLRIFLEESKMKHISLTKPKIHINLPEKKVYITKTELDRYKSLGTEINAFKTIFGLIDNKSKVNENHIENEQYKKIDFSEENYESDFEDHGFQDLLGNTIL